jgi:hypothetical protein
VSTIDIVGRPPSRRCLALERPKFGRPDGRWESEEFCVLARVARDREKDRTKREV